MEALGVLALPLPDRELLTGGGTIGLIRKRPGKSLLGGLVVAVDGAILPGRVWRLATGTPTRRNTAAHRDIKVNRFSLCRRALDCWRLLILEQLAHLGEDFLRVAVSAGLFGAHHTSAYVVSHKDASLSLAPRFHSEDGGSPPIAIAHPPSGTPVGIHTVSQVVVIRYLGVSEVAERTGLSVNTTNRPLGEHNEQASR